MTFGGAHARGVALLVLSTVVWGSTFPLLKQATDAVSPGVLMAVRFAVAALVCAPWLRRATPGTWRDGAVLGAISFFALFAQVVGLGTISASRGAFITGLNVILVPLIAGALLARAVPGAAYLSALVAVLGIGVMSFEGGAPGAGDAWVFGCAVSYALYVLYVERVTHRHDPLALTATQLAVVAALGFAWSAPEVVSGGLPALPTRTLLAILYLGLFATAFTTLAQAVAQRAVPAYEAAVVYALEPVFAAAFSFALLGERLGWRGLLGGALVLAATLFSQRPAKPGREAAAD